MFRQVQLHACTFSVAPETVYKSMSYHHLSALRFPRLKQQCKRLNFLFASVILTPYISDIMRWKRYLCSVGIIIVLRALDLLLTYHYTPDLTCEWNPLVSLFGVSWQGFIITQVLIVSFVAILMYFYFNRKNDIKHIEDGLSFNDFIYVYFFGKLHPWPQRIFTMPTNAKIHLEFNGFILMFITIFVSLFAIINNLLLIFSIQGYIAFLTRHAHAFFPLFFGAAILLSAGTFFTKEYRRYLLYRR